MLPVLFTVTIQPSWGLWVWMAVSIAVGAWQWRGARKAGENPRQALKAFIYWTAGSSAVLLAAVRALGGQNILNLSQPLAVPVHTYGILVAGGPRGPRQGEGARPLLRHPRRGDDRIARPLHHRQLGRVRARPGRHLRVLEGRPRLLRRVHRRRAVLHLVHAPPPDGVLPLRGRDGADGGHRPGAGAARLLRRRLLLGRGMRRALRTRGALSARVARVPEPSLEPHHHAGRAEHHPHPHHPTLRSAGHRAHLPFPHVLAVAQALPRRASGALSDDVRAVAGRSGDVSRRRGARARPQLPRRLGPARVVEPVHQRADQRGHFRRGCGDLRDTEPQGAFYGARTGVESFPWRAPTAHSSFPRRSSPTTSTSSTSR